MDEIGAAHVAKALFSYNKQVIFATHDTDMIRRPEYAIDRVLVLDEHAVAFDGAPVAFEPFPDVAHSAVAGEVGARHQCRTSVLFHQVGERKRRGVVMLRMAAQDQRKGPSMAGA